MHVHLLPAVFAALGTAVSARQLVPAKRQAAANPYVPTATSCPTSLIRSADSSLNADEQAYIEQRTPKAASALSAWLAQALQGFSAEQLPTLALALSGGGTKAGMTTAGAVYGLDGRESSNSPVAGLLQSMTYISALSGGSLTLSGVMGNNFEKISTLRTALLDQSYQNAAAAPLANAAAVREDIGNKTAAGFPTTLVDAYGKTISYDYISSSCGSNLHWSDITSQSSFQDHEAPYPIITITQANVAANMCEPNTDSAIWEISPAEFGSFDEMVGAFYPTMYMGTKNSDSIGECIVGFDNVGFLSAISSNILIPTNDVCTTGNFTSSEFNNTLATLISTLFPNISSSNPYGIIPNPFYQSSEAGIIRSQESIYGTDGGYSGQTVPIFPWLQPARAVDVIFVVDATTALPSNITNGTSVYETYLSAQKKGLPRMPLVPTPDQLVQQNLTSRAQFYGCHDPSVATIIYLPNTELADAPTEFLATPEQINSTIADGTAMVTQSQSADDSAAEWASCLACAIIHKNVTTATLPDVCTGCLEKYCWPTENGTDSSTPGDGGEATTGGDGGGSESGTVNGTIPSTGTAAVTKHSVGAVSVLGVVGLIFAMIL